MKALFFNCGSPTSVDGPWYAAGSRIERECLPRANGVRASRRPRHAGPTGRSSMAATTTGER
jgi:hypothetical protein